MAALFARLNPCPAFPADTSGKYDVGTLDVELPVSLFTSTGLSPAAPQHTNGELHTIICRILYPASLKGEAMKNMPDAKTVRWLPSPRKEYLAGYVRFLGIRDVLASALSAPGLNPFSRLLYYINIPIVPSHPLLPMTEVDKFPTVVFSHGLGGTRNSYSHLCYSVASHGTVVLAIEHRDGSAPITFVRQPAGRPTESGEGVPRVEATDLPATPSSSGSSTAGDDEKVKAGLESITNEQLRVKKEAKKETNGKPAKAQWKRIDYISHPHELSDYTAALRNRQFEIRFWELGILYAFIQKLNKGWQASDTTEDVIVNPHNKHDASKTTELLQMFKSRLNVEKPSSIVWMGHSFGAATVTQFVKSIWYWPKLSSNDTSFKPLYVPLPSLLEHFQPDTSRKVGPTVVILDLWTLPLLGNRTRALWRLPLPGPAIGILSQEFYVWKDNMRGNRHVISLTGGGFGGVFGDDDTAREKTAPSAADEKIPRRKATKRSQSMDLTAEIPGGMVGSELSKTAAVEEDDTESVPSSETGLSTPRDAPDRKLYYAPSSAHLSQSDFGILFQRFLRATGKVDNGERTMDYNIRAVVEFMRLNGQFVGAEPDADIFQKELEGWEKIPLELHGDGKEVNGKIEKDKNEAAK